MISRITMLSKLVNCPVAVMSLSTALSAEAVLRTRSSTIIPEVRSLLIHFKIWTNPQLSAGTLIAAKSPHTEATFFDYEVVVSVCW